MHARPALQAEPLQHVSPSPPQAPGVPPPEPASVGPGPTPPSLPPEPAASQVPLRHTPPGLHARLPQQGSPMLPQGVGVPPPPPPGVPPPPPPPDTV